MALRRGCESDEGSSERPQRNLQTLPKVQATVDWSYHEYCHPEKSGKDTTKETKHGSRQATKEEET